ncbi:hypothetical protein Tco_1128191 [Tanacetum coccineum]
MAGGLRLVDGKGLVVCGSIVVVGSLAGVGSGGRLVKRNVRHYKLGNEDNYERSLYWGETDYMEGEDGALSWFNAGVQVGVGGRTLPQRLRCSNAGNGVGRRYYTARRRFSTALGLALAGQRALG